MDDDQIIEAFISQHYQHHSVPPLILARQVQEVEALQSMLAEYAGHKVQIVTRPTGPRPRMAGDGGKKRANWGGAYGQPAGQPGGAPPRALQQALGLPESAQRFECFDISHTMGEATVASCVVYDQSSMQKSDYRRFNITTPVAGDDYGAMREVLQRRYRRLVTGEGKMPDVVLIDGGKGQLGIAREVMAELGISEVTLVGVAKGEDRKAGTGGLVDTRSRCAVSAGAGTPGPAPGAADPRRGAPLRHHRPIARRRGKARSQSPLENIAGVGRQAPPALVWLISADCAACRRRVWTNWHRSKACRARWRRKSIRNCTEALPLNAPSLAMSCR